MDELFVDRCGFRNSPHGVCFVMTDDFPVVVVVVVVDDVVEDDCCGCGGGGGGCGGGEEDNPVRRDVFCFAVPFPTGVESFVGISTRSIAYQLDEVSAPPTNTLVPADDVVVDAFVALACGDDDGDGSEGRVDFFRVLEEYTGKGGGGTEGTGGRSFNSFPSRVLSVVVLVEEVTGGEEEGGGGGEEEGGGGEEVIVVVVLVEIDTDLTSEETSEGEEGEEGEERPFDGR